VAIPIIGSSSQGAIFLPHDRRHLQRDGLPFPGRALVAVGRATGFVPHCATRSGACCINSCSTIAAAVATFSEFAIPSIGIATA